MAVPYFIINTYQWLMLFFRIANDRHYGVLSFCFVALDCKIGVCRVETRPTRDVMSWNLIQYDWTPTVGLKPDLAGMLWVGV